ncbi:MAG TPA: MBL fold metallo-hydrolase [Streptosporangiaceae bacterium]|nr:MBL fold metallo-hydrolase [Streptosporangiaceae bacterium]
MITAILGPAARAPSPTLGWVDLPRSASIHGAPETERLREPVPGVLLLADGGWLLLDTGFNTALIADEALRRRYHGDPLVQPVLPGPGEPLVAELAGAGIGPGDIRAVAISHLHYDHAGGDTEIAPGVTAVLTAGHTPGHQSFVVDIDESAGGGFVFACDAADLTENIEDELPAGGFTGVPPEVTAEQVRRLKRIAAARGYRVIPGHDPAAWPALTRELAAGWPPRRLR